MILLGEISIPNLTWSLAQLVYLAFYPIADLVFDDCLIHGHDFYYAYCLTTLPTYYGFLYLAISYVYSHTALLWIDDLISFFSFECFTVMLDLVRIAVRLLHAYFTHYRLYLCLNHCVCRAMQLLVAFHLTSCDMARRLLHLIMIITRLDRAYCSILPSGFALVLRASDFHRSDSDVSFASLRIRISTRPGFEKMCPYYAVRLYGCNDDGLPLLDLQALISVSTISHPRTTVVRTRGDELMACVYRSDSVLDCSAYALVVRCVGVNMFDFPDYQLTYRATTNAKSFMDIFIDGTLTQQPTNNCCYCDCCYRECPRFDGYIYCHLSRAYSVRYLCHRPAYY